MARTLHPGDVVCGEKGERFQTLLGSCVSIILTDKRRTLGAMCHIVHSASGTASLSDRANTAHAVHAMATMFQQLRARGVNPLLCEAYVYGGGNMFPSFDMLPVGEINVRWALETLAHEGIRVIDRDVGGTRYRRLGWTIGAAPPEVTAIEVSG